MGPSPAESAAVVSDSIRMGQMAVATQGQQLRSLLGSCVGIALYDRQLGVGGLAHVVLPYSQGKTALPGKYVDTAIPTLVAQLQQLVSQRLRLEAKLAGGASMFKTQAAVQIGQRNVETAIQLLKVSGIPIRAQHCGGEVGRKMTLEVSTGVVTIEIVGQQTLII